MGTAAPGGPGSGAIQIPALLPGRPPAVAATRRPRARCPARLARLAVEHFQRDEEDLALAVSGSGLEFVAEAVAIHHTSLVLRAP